MPAPYLRRIWLDPSRVPDREAYPFCLPFLHDDFELSFDRAITIIAGENGTGKSTLLEGIAVLAGYDEAGGGKGYRPVDHSNAIEATGGDLSEALRAGWLPKITNGWFFRAESFFSVARYLDEAARGNGPPPDFLSYSHGEGFLRFFEERCQKQGTQTNPGEQRPGGESYTLPGLPKREGAQPRCDVEARYDEAGSNDDTESHVRRAGGLRQGQTERQAEGQPRRGERDGAILPGAVGNQVDHVTSTKSG